jgi:hypothetical protein
MVHCQSMMKRGRWCAASRQYRAKRREVKCVVGDREDDSCLSGAKQCAAAEIKQELRM